MLVNHLPLSKLLHHARTVAAHTIHDEHLTKHHVYTAPEQRLGDGAPPAAVPLVYKKS